jgi:glycogen(starch) synthase
MNIKTLMLGWEFPPFISGGLGTACYGLTKAMDHLGMQVIFVLPRMKPVRFVGGAAMAGAGRRSSAPLEQEFPNVRFRAVPSGLAPYGRFGPSAQPVPHATVAARAELLEELPGEPGPYGVNINEEVQRYAIRAAKIAQSEEFDIIHAHDWMTFPAGIAVAAYSRKPLVVQVHSTEFDRSGEHVNQCVYDIERQGMHAAAKVIAVSNYTRNIVVSRYAVPPEKVEVIYNGIDPPDAAEAPAQPARPSQRDKVVLFLGRITMQKGPEYFLYAAKRVLEKEKHVKFIMAGDGDRLCGTIELAAWLGIGHRVFFTRFLRGADVDNAYRMADLYVMPSVSEPFGLAPLEALRNNVPVLISKQSGIAETLQNALKVDFWDINEMANKMVAVLRHPPLQETLRANGHKEVLKFRWEDSAARVNDIYHRVLKVA